MSPESLSRQIGILKDKCDALKGALPKAQSAEQYDRIAIEIERLEYQIEILVAHRDIARMEQSQQ